MQEKSRFCATLVTAGFRAQLAGRLLARALPIKFLVEKLEEIFTLRWLRGGGNGYFRQVRRIDEVISP